MTGQRDVDKPTIVGIIVLGLAVAAYSSYAQFMTAHLSGVPVPLAWVLPVSTDAIAAVATRVWLSQRYEKKIRRYAAFIALLALAVGFGFAAAHDVAAGVVWMRLAVGGVPTLGVAALVHLGAMIGAQSARDRARVARASAAAGTTAGRPAKTADTGGRATPPAAADALTTRRGSERPAATGPDRAEAVASAAGRRLHAVHNDQRSAAEATGRHAAELPTEPDVDVSDLLPAAREVAAELGDRLSRDALIDGLRSRGLSVGGRRRAAIYRAVVQTTEASSATTRPAVETTEAGGGRSAAVGGEDR
jgi:hypothetical protein